MSKMMSVGKETAVASGMAWEQLLLPPRAAVERSKEHRAAG
jgi:hypothetical protein